MNEVRRSTPTRIWVPRCALIGMLVGCGSPWPEETRVWVESDFIDQVEEGDCALESDFYAPETDYRYTFGGPPSSDGGSLFGDDSLVVVADDGFESFSDLVSFADDFDGDFWELCRPYSPESTEFDCSLPIQFLQEAIDLSAILGDICGESSDDFWFYGNTDGILISEDEIRMNHRFDIRCGGEYPLYDTYDCYARYGSILRATDD